jgi:two-component system sensor histidine kinase TctE
MSGRPAPDTPPRGPSLRRQLLWGILLPVLALVVFNTANLYRQALAAADTAYDRTLLASAKAIGELLQVAPGPGPARLVASVPYSALEAFEADNRSRMYFKVTGFEGEMVSGFEDLPNWQGALPERSVYAALVEFHDDEFRGSPVRVAVLLQPVAGAAGQGMATIQVAETLELRRTLARQLLLDTLWSQVALVAVIAVVVVAVVQRATRPVRALSDGLQGRAEDDLSPITAPDAPTELRPMLEATNAVMARLAHLLDNQKRFVRDASHQLRTPLAVLKTQVQSARRGDLAPEQALAEIAHTVDGATELANQMLALAKVEQLRQQQAEAALTDWAPLVRAVSLDLSALIAGKQLDFELSTQTASVQAHEWMLRELTRNLLHNAIKQSPEGARLLVSLAADDTTVALTVADSGPGIAAELRTRLFQPFSGGHTAGGAGLGLAICREIVHSLGGSIQLDNREHGGRTVGLDAVVRLPRRHLPAPSPADTATAA